jgi:hypothetical protein
MWIFGALLQDVAKVFEIKLKPVYPLNLLKT